MTAISLWTGTHAVAHILIAVAGLLAAGLMGVLTRTSGLTRLTRIAAAAFFVSIAVLHLALAINHNGDLSAWATLADHVEAFSLVTFLSLRIIDQQRINRTLQAGIIAIGVKYGPEAADEMAATVDAALRRGGQGG